MPILISRLVANFGHHPLHILFIFFSDRMANFQLGSSLPEDDEDDEVGTKERRQSLRKKRHYKKDSRFLLDLYTLTFDENEDVDELATCTARLAGEEDDLNGFCFSAPSSPTSIRSRASSALTKVAMPKLSSPISLNLVSLPSAAVGKASSSMQRKSIPCLETNLHKILARKFLDSEEVSFRKAKLLTKAYYQLLRTTNNADIEASKEIQYGYLIIELFTTLFTQFRNLDQSEKLGLVKSCRCE